MFTEQQFTIPPLKGISAQTIEEHLKLYAGYVKNANTVLEKIAAYQGDDSHTYELGELSRHFSFEFNGIRNHECYFAILGAATPIAPTSALAQQIDKQWGSFDAYKNAHLALATTTRGIGWAMLSCDPCTMDLFLHWVDEQHLGQLQGTAPIIALDMWEHSYVADYQPSGKKTYAADFLEQVNWNVVEARYTALAQKK